jgi:hypothetical protein
MTEFRNGDIVRWNAKWRSYGRPQPRTVNRRGTVVGTTRNDLVRVRWEGRKGIMACLPDFLQRVPANTDPLPPEIEARFAHVEITPDEPP